MLRDYGKGTRAAVMEMLDRSKSQYFDLLLLHSWHFSSKRVLEAWQVLEQLQAEGLVKAIGLSNVEVPLLKWIIPRVRLTFSVHSLTAMIDR